MSATVNERQVQFHTLRGMAKQAAWSTYKAQSLADRLALRRPSVTIAEVRPPRNCTCDHTPKKHKQSGRCRKDCTCTAGARSRA